MSTSRERDFFDNLAAPAPEPPPEQSNPPASQEELIGVSSDFPAAQGIDIFLDDNEQRPARSVQSPVASGPAATPWSAPALPSQQQEAARPAAAGASGTELLREQLRASDLIAPRKTPSSHGWRKMLYQISSKAINVGESADERRVRHLNGIVASNLRGSYTVAVLGGKGGAGKTVTTAAVGSMFRSVRTDPVVAIDADPAQAANLAARIDPKSASVREINADTSLLRYSDVRSYAGQNCVGLDVVASPRHADSGGPAISPDEFAKAHTVLQRFYNVLLVDCGVDLDHPVMPEVLGRADSIVMVASAAPDGAVGASTNLEWLHQSGYQQLLSRVVLVLNHIRGSTSRKDKKASRQLVAALVEHFSRWVPPERIFVVPFDPHIATADVVELNDLKPTTRRRVLEITAALASGFSATADKR